MPLGARPGSARRRSRWRRRIRPEQTTDQHPQRMTKTNSNPASQDPESKVEARRGWDLDIGARIQLHAYDGRAPRIEAARATAGSNGAPSHSPPPPPPPPRVQPRAVRLHDVPPPAARPFPDFERGLVGWVGMVHRPRPNPLFPGRFPRTRRLGYARHRHTRGYLTKKTTPRSAWNRRYTARIGACHRSSLSYYCATPAHIRSTR